MWNMELFSNLHETSFYFPLVLKFFFHLFVDPEKSQSKLIYFKFTNTTRNIKNIRDVCQNVLLGQKKVRQECKNIFKLFTSYLREKNLTLFNI